MNVHRLFLGLGMALLGPLAACTDGAPNGTLERAQVARNTETSLDGICLSIGGGDARATSPLACATCSPETDARDTQAVIDGDYNSYVLRHHAGIDGSGPDVIGATAQQGVVFPAGTVAGALIRMPPGDGTDPFVMTVRTYLSGTLAYTGVAVVWPPSSEPYEPQYHFEQGADAFYGIASTAFDTIELQFDRTQTCEGDCGDLRIYEICTLP